MRAHRGSDTAPSREELIARARDGDGLLTLLTERVDAALLLACPKLRVVSNMAVGVDNIDVPGCTQRRIVVGHTPGVLTHATADWAGSGTEPTGRARRWLPRRG